MFRLMFRFSRRHLQYPSLSVCQSYANFARVVSTYQDAVRDYLAQNSSYRERLEKIIAAQSSISSGNKKSTTTVNWNYRLVLPYLDSIPRLNDKKLLVALSFCASLNVSHPSCVKAQRLIYNQFKANMILLEKLDLMEVSILCSSLFRANVIVSSKPILQKIDRLAVDEIRTTGISARILPLLKILRKADFRTDELMQTIADALCSESSLDFNLAFFSHSLAVLADGRFYSEDETRRIARNLSVVLEKAVKSTRRGKQKFVHPKEGARAKDLTRSLWALSCLKIDSKLFEQIADLVTEDVAQRWDCGEFVNEPHLVSDLLLSLASHGLYPQRLLEKVVNEELVSAISRQNQSTRESRFALFAVSAITELPYDQVPAVLRQFSKLKVTATEDMEKLLKRRSILGRLFAVIRNGSSERNWSNVRCWCPIPYLNVCGITFETKGEKVAIEVFDPHVCMRHTEIPDRLMSLKTRLLQRMGYHVIQVTPRELKRDGHLSTETIFNKIEQIN